MTAVTISLEMHMSCSTRKKGKDGSILPLPFISF